jgi:hypothetical protein
VSQLAREIFRARRLRNYIHRLAERIMTERPAVRGPEDR